jgi:ATP/maltotriose-dependent transcriptional regulator MalT
MARINLCGHLLDIDIDAAERENEAAFALLRSLPGQPRMTYCLQARARIAQRRGDYGRFAELAREAYDYAMGVGDCLQVIDALLLRAQAARLVAAFQEALGYVEEAILVSGQEDSVAFLAFAIYDGALVAHARGDHRQAVRWTIAATRVEETAGISLDLGPVEWLTTVMVDAREAIGPDAVGVEEEVAGRLSLSMAAGEIRAYRIALLGDTLATNDASATRLTAREVEVLSLVASGLTDAQIADTLYIARSTVSRHVSNILAKLDAATRTAAVDNAYRLGLIERPASSAHHPSPYT